MVLVAGRDRVNYSANAAQGGKVSIFHCTHFEQHHLQEVLEHFLEGRMQSRLFCRTWFPQVES